jgi:hypothetical protein
MPFGSLQSLTKLIDYFKLFSRNSVPTNLTIFPIFTQNHKITTILWLSHNYCGLHWLEQEHNMEENEAWDNIVNPTRQSVYHIMYNYKLNLPLCNVCSQLWINISINKYGLPLRLLQSNFTPERVCTHNVQLFHIGLYYGELSHVTTYCRWNMLRINSLHIRIIKPQHNTNHGHESGTKSDNRPWKPPGLIPHHSMEYTHP